MALFGSAMLFALACNLDTLVLALGFGLRGTRPTPAGCLILAGLTTAVTALSLELGVLGGGLLPPALANRGGGLVLVGMGLWILLDWLRTWDAPPPPLPEMGHYCSLAATLAFNNAGAGLAAGVTGVSPLWGGVANFAVTLLFLPLGLYLGRRLRGGRLAELALPLSGALLLLLGAAQAQV